MTALSPRVLVKAWARDPVLHPDQLTHAAESGRPHAMCGVSVTAWDSGWPVSNLLEGERRCPICAQAFAGRRLD